MQVKSLIMLILTILIFIRLHAAFSVPNVDAKEIRREWGYDNTVTTVYLKDRMFDTVFEVLVFSTVVFGIVSYHTSGAGQTKLIDDFIFKRVASFLSFFLLLSSLYLGLTGHMYPGGGFTAGVAGGTALFLMAFSRGFEEFESEFERYKVDKVEKFLFGVIPIMTIMEFKLGLDEFIIAQNLLIYFKVMAGTWIVIHNLLKNRGIA